MEKLFNNFFQIKFIKIRVEKSYAVLFIYKYLFILFKINFSFNKSTIDKNYILLIVICSIRF